MYTQELIDEVKELYPNSPEMHKHAELGSVWLGRYLDDSSHGGIGLNEILYAPSLESLKDKARLLIRKRELYAKWCEQDPRRNNF